MPESYKTSEWIPVTVKEAHERGIDVPDVIIVSGDAYVDHPAFGTAIIGRLLEKLGLQVVIIAQPNWQDDLRDFKKFGKPRLFFAVTAGNMDSMINHYTANKRKRSDDAYTASGKAGFRPDYAVTVYSRILKKLYPDSTIIIGGIEASLRRFTHYDYWSDALKPSILIDSGADLLVYGMGELPLIKIVENLKSGIPVNEFNDIPQTACIVEDYVEHTGHDILLPSHNQQLTDKRKFGTAFRLIEEDSNSLNPKRIIEPYDKVFVIVNKPYPPISTQQLDEIYDLPFNRKPHPRYHKKGLIPAYEMIRHSVNIHRGCFGGCSFCTISAHQGKFVSSRSESSVLKEVEQITRMQDFKGHITDLGGPSANMYMMQGKKISVCEKCTRPSCIFPEICGNLNNDHSPLLKLYQKAESIKGVKKITIGSGIRYDIFMPLKPGTTNYQYAKQLITRHTSGRLKVAPEHSSPYVLQMMRKPPFRQYLEFSRIFNDINREAGLKQQLIPYLISSHPGSRIEDMAKLASDISKTGYKPEQVQDFTPTPMTLASVMYYCGFDPYTMQKIFCARNPKEKSDQQKFLFWYKPEYMAELKQLLHQRNRVDLFDELYPGSKKTNFAQKSTGKNAKQNRKKH